jgi:uncharacterized protein (DUF2141 family)
MKKFALTITLALLALIGLSQNGDSFNISVKISNIKNTTGQIVVGLYNTSDSFLGTPFLGEISNIEGKTITVAFNGIKKGTYAISLFHDENSNNKLDTNFMGIPKERFACSNNASGFMGPPKWEDAKFEVDKNIAIEISF